MKRIDTIKTIIFKYTFRDNKIILSSLQVTVIPSEIILTLPRK